MSQLEGPLKVVMRTLKAGWRKGGLNRYGGSSYQVTAVVGRSEFDVEITDDMRRAGISLDFIINVSDQNTPLEAIRSQGQTV